MAVNGIKGEEDKTVVLSPQTNPQRFLRPRVTFKENCKGDFITINVSGRRFEADNSIFERHPGKYDLDTALFYNEYSFYLEFSDSVSKTYLHWLLSSLGIWSKPRVIMSYLIRVYPKTSVSDSTLSCLEGFISKLSITSTCNEIRHNNSKPKKMKIGWRSVRLGNKCYNIPQKILLNGRWKPEHKINGFVSRQNYSTDVHQAS